MTTSGNTIYQLTRNEILEAAIGALGVLAEGQAPSSDDYTVGAKLLGTTIARFRTFGMPLWARMSYTWTPTTSSYTIGDGQTLDTPYPLHLLQAYRTNSSGTKINIDIESDYNYNTFPSNSGGQIPYKISYTPKVNLGTIKLWPTDLSTNTETLTIVYTRPFEYFDSSTHTMDLPEEWYDAVIYDVAVKLAPRFGVPIPDRQELKKEAKVYLDQAMEFNFEDASFFVTPQRNQ
jgi:hypothetical protein